MVLSTIRKAVTYRRVSGDSQKDNFSLRSQANRCSAYCQEEWLTILREFVDVGSGLSTKYRPQFMEMLEFAMDETNGVTDIVFDQLDRYFRNHREFNEYTDKLVTAGITLHLAAEREEVQLPHGREVATENAGGPEGVQEDLHKDKDRPEGSHQARLSHRQAALGITGWPMSPRN